MERIVTVVPEAGLHARPASKLVRTANRFDAEVSIGRATEKADADGEPEGDGSDSEELVPANSMLSVTGLNVAHGESVRIVAEGPEAEAALDAIRDLLTTPVEETGSEDGGDDE